MAKIYGIISTKGGVGKTTVTANLGGILADMGQRVLLIDADFQQSLTAYFQIDAPAPGGLKESIIHTDATNCISKTNIDGLDIICSNDPEQELITWLRQTSSHIHYLKALIRILSPFYDYILIDSQGASGILQEAVIHASDVLLSPITPEYLSAKEFIRGTIQMLRRMILPSVLESEELPKLYAIINRQDRTTDAAAVTDSLRRVFESASENIQVEVLHHTIPQMSAYNKAVGRQIPAHRYEVKRTGPTASAHDTMLKIAHELEPSLIDLTPSWSSATNS